MEKRKISNEELQKRMKELEDGMMKVISSGKWKDILDFQSKVYRYSWNNSLNAMLQAQIMGINIKGIFRGAKQWEEEFNRTVKESEKDRPLLMLAPNIKKYSKKPRFKPSELQKDDYLILKGRIIKKIYQNEEDNYGIFAMQVEEINGEDKSGYITIKGNITDEVKLFSFYEIEGKITLFKNGMYWERQVEVEAVNEIQYTTSYVYNTGPRGFFLVKVYDVNQTKGDPLPIDEYCKELQEDSEQAKKIYNALKNIIDIPVEEKPISYNGVFYPEELRIEIKKSLKANHKCKTLIHENAHYIVHKKKENGLDLSSYGEGGKGFEDLYAVEEVVVESVAYIVSKHFGFDTSEYSFEYVTGWAKGNPSCIKKIGSLIQEISREIIDGVLQELENTKEKVA